MRFLSQAAYGASTEECSIRQGQRPESGLRGPKWEIAGKKGSNRALGQVMGNLVRAREKVETLSRTEYSPYHR